MGFDFSMLKGYARSNTMSKSDIFGCALFSSFGLWLILAPQSVIRFYKWFHRNKLLPMPTMKVLRILGLFWIILVVIVWLLQARR
jgi:succinate-acetate transporter protein